MRRLRGEKAECRIFGKGFLLLAPLLLFVFSAGAQQLDNNNQASPNDQPDDTDKSKGWLGHAHDIQHTGVSSVRSQSLRRIGWKTRVDLQPQLIFGELLVHYGSPLITPRNTVIVPVKVGPSDGFRVEARNGRDGSELWRLRSDYSVPFAGFIPSFGPAVSQGNVVMPAAGGTVLVRTGADDVTGTVQRMAFYGIDKFRRQPRLFVDTIKINTRITADHSGNLYFGFIVLGFNPVVPQSGLARIGSDGKGSWVSAVAASNDLNITKVNMNCAPALSRDERFLYVAVDNFDFGFGYLLELDASTLQTVNQVRLVDPAFGTDALISDESSATPTVGPDGDVFFGVLENPFPAHNDRGWLLHFSADLRQQKTPGDFGWDDTSSIVDASLVPSYHGTSKYLITTKYNNYADRGGNGVNQLAIRDPNASMADFLFGNPVMNEVLTINGTTPDPRFPFLPGAVREWCINTAAVDPFTKSVLANSEDGKLYRWDLTTNTFSAEIALTGGIGEAYTPTVIGSDGTVYAINHAVLFALGK